jgi:manganese efflux pump family protein
VLFWSGGRPAVSLLAVIVLAFSMSADAFAAALGKGSALDRPPLGEALRCGLIFGFVEAITPVIGWTAGVAASAYIAAIDHWVAFAVLALIGGKMIWDALGRSAEGERPKRHSTRVMVVTAIGTSIDALAVGVGLALFGIGIAAPAIAIGLATFTMTTLGILLGRILGERFGRVAEILGGTALVVIGAKILIG